MSPSAATAGPSPRAVLITGASSGIGLAVAHRLAARGCALALLARSAPALDTAAADCRRAGAADVLVLPVDVADAAAVETAVARADSELGGLDACVHAAAVACYGRLPDVPVEVFDRVIDVNVKGSANLARAVLPRFAARRAGTLVLLGSVVGRIATPYLSTYGVSKWAVRAMARCLHIEARDTPGVRVCEVWPGSVNTPVYEQAASYAGRDGRPPPPVLTPDRVAAAVLRVLDRPRPRIGVGPANPLMVAGYTLAAPVYDRLVGPMMRRLGLGGPPVAGHPGNALLPQPREERRTGRWRGVLGRR